MMRCLLGCFRVTGADDGGAGREVKGGGGGDGQVVAPSLAQMTSHEVGGGKRARPPSRNALSAVFLREDEGSRLELTPSSWTDQREDMKKEQDLKHETIMQESCVSSLDTTNEPQRVLEDMDSVHQTECGPSMFDNVHLMESLNVEDCETPSRYHQSSTVPDAMSSSKVNEEMQTPATSNTTDWEGLTKESNTEASIQYHVLDPAEDYEKCTVSRPSEDFTPLDKPSGDPNCNENDNFAPIEITVSEECSLFQSSEDSVSSFDKINDSMSTTSLEKSLATEVITHSTRKKVLKNSDSEKEFPSLSQWLKPPNPKKPFRDESLTGDRSAKSSDEDRPIIGMVAAHWKDEEPEKFTPKWWDGNGIPNSTNKYKEDQKVSWHAMSFEERLEKALSEEKLLSERNCFSGKSSHFLGMEGEEGDTAESNHLYAAAHA
ncbi:hypothetical protein QOZ80_3BG0258970 [Eleusine coracana subsp. coracana]|nr:hypothetical protein QOZ80_3BG0258970 [Eleusine coracana subsp. coracana]